MPVTDVFHNSTQHQPQLASLARSRIILIVVRHFPRLTIARSQPQPPIHPTNNCNYCLSRCLLWLCQVVFTTPPGSHQIWSKLIWTTTPTIIEVIHTWGPSERIDRREWPAVIASVRCGVVRLSVKACVVASIRCHCCRCMPLRGG